MTIASFIAPEAFELDALAPDSRLRITPTPELRKHLKAQRIHVGQSIRLVDGYGDFMICELLEPLDKNYTSLTLNILEQGSEIEALQLILVQGISATDRMDLSLRQACELGVSEIVPLMSQRSKVRLDVCDYEPKQQRWQRIVAAACEQSGRATLPLVHQPVNLEQALALAAKCDTLICPWEEADGNSLSSAIERSRGQHDGSLTSAAVFIGPEGGFEASEVELMREHGAEAITLGQTILRTETASTVALALVTYTLGGLGADG
jgi:16S rRNA (uracil1498-N3)-methyltransferase